MKGLGKYIKFNYLIGSRTSDLPTCSIVPSSADMDSFIKYGTEGYQLRTITSAVHHKTLDYSALTALGELRTSQSPC
jgi:hypothetical protein